MSDVTEQRKPVLLQKAKDLAEKLAAGPSQGQSPVGRNVLQSSTEGYLTGDAVEFQIKLIRSLARRGNPLHRRSRQTGPQYRRLQDVIVPFLKDGNFTDVERRWTLGWTGRLLEVKNRLHRQNGRR